MKVELIFYLIRLFKDFKKLNLLFSWRKCVIFVKWFCLLLWRCAFIEWLTVVISFFWLFQHTFEKIVIDIILPNVFICLLFPQIQQHKFFQEIFSHFHCFFWNNFFFHNYLFLNFFLDDFILSDINLNATFCFLLNFFNLL